MKKLSKLGISPTPWKLIPYGTSTESKIPTFGSVKSKKETIFGYGVLRHEEYVLQYGQINNARLIAAAPKMYKKAWELITAFDKRIMTPKHIEALRAALAEASGEKKESK